MRKLSLLQVQQGQSSVQLNLQQLPSGLYGYRLEVSGSTVQHRKLALVK